MPRIVAIALAVAFVVVGCAPKASTSSAALRQAQRDTVGAQRNTVRAQRNIVGAQRDTVGAQRGTSAVPIRVVTTFSTLNSFVQGVGGDRVQVQNLVPVGASPENYQPSPQDIATLSRAQIVVENGAGIDVWLRHMIQSAGNADMREVVLSNGLPIVDHNPHLWMDPTLAQAYVGKIREALVQIDPAHKVDYERNAHAYDARLSALQHWIAGQIATIPPRQRAMIIFHNAFDYYDRRFGIQTVGVIELSPGQDPNPAYIGQLVDLARSHHVRAVFSEPEYSPKLAQTLAKSAGIQVVSNLYDDSIGNDPRVGNYIDMMRYDTGVIVEALR